MERGARLKILVCVKQVPQKDVPLKLNESGTWIRDDVSYEVNEPDAYALEEALRQREKHGGEVVVITAGPARAQQVLREALAKGANRAIHLEDDRFVTLDPLNLAKVLAAAVKDEQFDLIFTGLQSDDYGFAQTGVLLAELLGWPHATIIMQIENKDGGIRVKRELESGFFQFVDMPVPAVLTIQSGHQQAQVCDADRHQAGQDQAHAQGDVGRGQLRCWRHPAKGRAPLRAAEDKEDRVPRWLAGRHRQETGRQAAQ